MLELDYKENWVPKNWCFCTVVLEKTLESPLDCKEIQPVHTKGNQSWIFIGGTGAEAETPILWSPYANNSLEKPLMLGKIGGGEGDNKGLDGCMASLTQWTWVWVNSELVVDREAWRAAVHEVTKSQTWLHNWAELNWLYLMNPSTSHFLRKCPGYLAEGIWEASGWELSH